jgi:hypothetical protein
VSRAHRTFLVRAALAFAVATSLAACGGGSGGTVEGVTTAVAPTAAAPTGPKTDAAIADQPYAYTMDAGDTGGATVAFAIENKPAWAEFDATTGTLSGTPGRGDVGSSANVRLTATAGTARTSVELQLKVVASADGAVTIALGRPTTRTDGSALANLAGYRIYYGRTPTRLDQFVDVNDPALTDARVANLTPGTWYFAATAYDRAGFESEPSEVTPKTIG